MRAFDMGIDHVTADADTRQGSITVPATLEHLDEIYDLIHAALRQEGCPFSVVNQLDVVIEEVFVNICSYAYAGGDTTGSCRMDYACRTNPSSIVIRFVDWGIPFDPLAHEDPKSPTSVAEAQIGGLGILMVKRMTDRVSYVRVGDANELTFKKDW